LLDNIIQLTEKDECAYQEMIAHLPLFSHPNPKDVLIVGGGDGGVVREVCKHPEVKRIVCCELDQMVVDVCKKFFPSLSCSWGDKRVKLLCGDATKYLESVKDEFDVIICDSSDPIANSPAQALFESAFYRSMNTALHQGGRIATQAESIWCDLDLIKGLFQKTYSIFSSVEYATTQIPTYTCGQIGFLLCCKTDSKTPDTCKKPIRKVPRDMELKYYHEGLHEASFALPLFVIRAIEEALASTTSKKEMKVDSQSAGAQPPQKNEKEAKNQPSSSEAKKKKKKKKKSKK